MGLTHRGDIPLSNERGRQLGRPRSDRHTRSRANYGLSAPDTLLNVLFRLVPVACTATMITTAIPAAMRPYSMAVTPELSFKKRRTSLLIEISISVKCTVHAKILGRSLWRFKPLCEFLLKLVTRDRFMTRVCAAKLASRSGRYDKRRLDLYSVCV